MVKVLFVCLGNICRSPMAEAVFRAKIEEKGLADKIYADSAGTAGYHIGEAPDERTLRVLSDNDINTTHKGRVVSRSDFDHFDLMIAMDASNYQNLLHLKQEHSSSIEIRMLRDFEPNPSGDKEVPDPYYGNMEDFELVFEISRRISDNLIEYLKSSYNL